MFSEAIRTSNKGIIVLGLLQHLAFLIWTPPQSTVVVVYASFSFLRANLELLTAISAPLLADERAFLLLCCEPLGL